MRFKKALVIGTAAVAIVGIGYLAPTPTASVGFTSTTASTLAKHPGKLLASNCFQCHGTNGRGGAFETLAGKTDIYNEMKQMQTGIEGTGIMNVHAQAYTDAELRLIADFFAKAA